jgi:predicted enzyme involved in methoxymalonyl-ACP biosynthesis
MVLREVIAHAKREAVRTLVGVYRPTDRNKMVEGHYEKLGFSQTLTDEDGTTMWELAVDEANVAAAPMKVTSFGLDTVRA